MPIEFMIVLVFQPHSVWNHLWIQSVKIHFVIRSTPIISLWMTLVFDLFQNHCKKIFILFSGRKRRWTDTRRSFKRNQSTSYATSSYSYSIANTQLDSTEYECYVEFNVRLRMKFFFLFLFFFPNNNKKSNRLFCMYSPNLGVNIIKLERLNKGICR